MAQIKTKFITDKAVTAVKLGSGAATATQPLFADGSGGAAYRSIAPSDVPTLNQNTTGTAANVTATSNATLTTLSALTTATSLASVGTITTGVWNGTAIDIAHGGTGQTTANAAFAALSPMTTAGDLIYENSTPLPARLGIGSTGQVLTVVGGLPAWAAPSISPSSIALTQNHILVGNASNLAADVAMSGEATIVASGAVTLSNAAVIAKVLTGYSSGAGTITSADSILSAIEKLNGNDALYLPLAGGTMSGNIDMGGNSITSLASPVNPNDAVNKSYVDNFINATSWKQPVLVATTANITLSGEQTIDGVATSASRVLVKNQTAPEENGIYVSDAGAWSRSADMDAWSEVPAAAVFVEEGTANADIGFVCTSDPGGTLGTTAITWVQFSSAGAYSADNVTLQLVGGVFSIKNGGVTNTQVSASAAIAFSKLAALTSAHILVGNGSNVATDVAVSGDLSLANTGAFSITATSNATLTTLSALTTATSLASVGTITTGTWNATTIAINHGGTGQTTAAAAYNALSPMTTTGDIEYEASANTAARLPIGSTGQVLTVVAGIPAWQSPATTLTVTEDNITLSGTDITNQFVDLAHAAQGASASINSLSLNVVGGPEQLKTVDYTVSLTGGSGGVTRVTFAGDLATGGAAALIAGDILMIKYAY